MSCAYPLVRKRNACSTRCGVRTSPSRSGFSPSRVSSSRIRASIPVFYIALLAVPLTPAAQEDPDALYRDRANIASARRAADLWTRALESEPKDFEAAWKLARTMYWLGNHEDTEKARRAALERGIAVARQAAALEPKRPEGYFWTAANMGTLAESFGLRQGLRYRGQIKDALETVLRIDAGYQDGSADRALGRWYHKVPGLFGGSNRKSEEHLRKSLTYNPHSTVSRFFLAETLFELDRDAEARAELQKVLDAPLDPDWEPEDREYKQKAAERLTRR
jgi:tetratricopeptide (TPR) repeat protein